MSSQKIKSHNEILGSIDKGSWSCGSNGALYGGCNNRQ